MIIDVVSWVISLSISFVLLMYILFSHYQIDQPIKEVFTLGVSFFAGICTLCSVLFLIYNFYKVEEEKVEIKSKEAKLRLYEAYKNYHSLSNEIFSLRHTTSNLDQLDELYDLKSSEFAFNYWEIKALSDVINDSDVNEAFKKLELIHKGCMNSLINLKSSISMFNNEAINTEVLQMHLDQFKARFGPFNMVETLNIITRATVNI